MQQRTLFVQDCSLDLFPVSELSQRYGISRKTAYKWLDRFAEQGVPGLADRARRPESSPNKTPERVVDAILEARFRHPTWGPKKLLKIVEKRLPEHELPARSTVANILKRSGCIKARRRSCRKGHPGKPKTPMREPNELWSADFKGQFRTADGRYCYPLTIADGFSRYLLVCQAFLAISLKQTKSMFKRAFLEYGLPKIIRTDNGVPFASKAIARLSRLSVWWIRLGIFPELIEPGKPQQNGRHERIHRTLKAETTVPRAGNLAAQQRRFNRFVTEYNEERPHEALSMETPSSMYSTSPRPFPNRLPNLDYPAHFEVRRVSRNGGIRWHSNWVNVGGVLEDQYVGFEEVDNEYWDVYFGQVRIGRFDERKLTITDILGRKDRRKV